MSWKSLPQELQLHIGDHLQRDDLKGFRLTNRSNAVVFATILFQTIHLTPNTRSFDRARGIALSPNLSQYVKGIVYHVGILEDVHNGFETFRADIMRLHHPVGSIENITKDILWKYNCFLEEIDGQRDFETRNELEEVQFLCHSLASLESLTIVLDEDDPFSPPQDFIGRRSGVQSTYCADGPHFSNLIQAAADKRLTTIRSWSTEWQCLPQIRGQVLESLDLENMQDFALGLFNSEFLGMDLDDQDSALEGLDALLKKTTASKLYTLQLDFDEIPFERGSTPLRSIFNIVTKHHWSSLKELGLYGITTTEDDLVHFLERHRTTLKSLSLDDIFVTEETSYDNNGNITIPHPGSVVVLLQRISETLDLTSATITGVFTNHRDESWYVNVEHEGEDCLRRKIELWLSGKAPSPFPKELLQRESTLSGSIWDHEIRPATQAEAEERSLLAMNCSDSSWVYDTDPIMKDS